MDYQHAWDYQEKLLTRNVQIKSALRNQEIAPETNSAFREETQHHLLFVEHPPVYTLGKSGHIENLLINDEERKSRGIQFFKINRGGDKYQS